MEDDTESCNSKSMESHSPSSRTRKARRKVDVYGEVLDRLQRLDVEETRRPGFEDELWAHFTRLPLRYALDVNVERAEDVLLHRRLLEMAEDPARRPAIEIRPVQMSSLPSGVSGGSVHLESPRNMNSECSTKSTNSILPLPIFSSTATPQLAFESNNFQAQDSNVLSGSGQLSSRCWHEIAISTNDRRKFLSQLTSLISEIGLNIQEAHAFSTMDGYSLDIFVVDGWMQTTEELRAFLTEHMKEIERCSLKSDVSAIGKQEQNGIKVVPARVSNPTNETNIWEIDASLLMFEKKIATGSFGELYKGTFCSQEVAIKVLRSEHLDRAMLEEFGQEVYIMRKIRHKNIVQFIGACTRRPNFCIVTEYMSGGSLFDFLHKQKSMLRLSTLLRLALDVSRGMSYLHQNNIIHRDLKAANCLLDENDVVKIGDFGVAREQVQSGVMTAETGTYRWMAPEVIEHKAYNHKADIFSFGIVLWEMLTGKLPYDSFTPLQAAVGVVHKGLRPTIPSNTHPEIRKLMIRCWEKDPSLRPEFSEIIEVLQHLATTVAMFESSHGDQNLMNPCDMRETAA